MPDFFNPGFTGRRRSGAAERIPPGQYETTDFPVLTAGPTPRVDTAGWTLTIDGLVDAPMTWSWDDFNTLPTETFVRDIHCVTKWSKLDTRWEGVSIDTLLERVRPQAEARYVLARCHGGYTTNVPLADLRDGKAFIGLRFDGAPLAAEHGGPARLVVPHLYFWKSAKWISGLRFLAEDTPGFWERGGYSMYGDPWKEQRYRADD